MKISMDETGLWQPIKGPDTPTAEQEIEELLAQLTLEEKISLLSAKDWWRTPVIIRENLFVPHIKTTDGPNGARGESYVSGIKAACFPSGTCIGATFNEALTYKIGQEIAKEAKSKSANVLLAPTVNMIRSPLGGRNYETYSEDPWILGKLGAAFINGCQSERIAATPKHFVANDTENRRFKLTAEIDEQTLREIYLYPFQLIMKYSNPLCFMTSYNRVNGTYVAEDPRLIDTVLRKEWGFNGLVISDWMGTYSTDECINAGMDLEMPGPTVWRGDKLLHAVKEGRVSESTIDASARRVLKLADDLGRFESPTEGPEIEKVDPERDELIAVAAAEGTILLKNTDNVLPIPSDSSLVVIGQHALIPTLGGGGSAKVNAMHAVSAVDGLRNMGIDFTYEPGVPVFGAVPHADPAIVTPTQPAAPSYTEGRPVKLEWFNVNKIGTNMAHEDYAPNAEYMIKEAWPTYLDAEYCTQMTFDLTPQTSGDHMFSVITTGTATVYINDQEVYHRPQEPSLLPESFYFYKAKIEHRFTIPMKANETYHIRLASWAIDPSVLAAAGGKIFQGSALRFFEHVDIPQNISKAAQTAKDSDVALIFVGTTNEIESEGYDREDMDLTSDQYDLISAVAAVCPRTVVINYSGSPVNITPFINSVAGFIQAGFPGQEGGHAIARVLSGHTDPGGRLPYSWPVKLEDNPSYGNFPCDKNDVIRYEEGLDVGYRYYDRDENPDPLFPFGFGLSYAGAFTVSGVGCGGKSWSPSGSDGGVEVSCRVTNPGQREGKVVIQLYVGQGPDNGPAAAAAAPAKTTHHPRPPKQLKGFQKFTLAAGESKEINFTLDKYSISFYDSESACWRANAGVYKALVGFSAGEIAGVAAFEITEGFTWKGV